MRMDMVTPMRLEWNAGPQLWGAEGMETFRSAPVNRVTYVT